MAPKKAAARKRGKRARKTEAVGEILFEHKVTAGLDRLAASGGLRNVDPDA